ncbi:Fanconi anemia group E protein-like isoform X1 [Myxocyprinus asiaticus]|uniref:Fanconi anemia group E protein-like isoform X1 n=1 Tax=Myxocyprinus asiaticus TaxID=70543 RepID=UPI0022222D88|nr:Fanconi anemia group E protein-like isoform X1 [Myxocyprinus asiaticus]
MDLTALMHRFDGRSRLLVHALHSGAAGASNAHTVYNKQRRCDPDFTLSPFLEALCQQEACVDADSIVSKPLVCLFSEDFKRNLLCFLHLIHSGLPRDGILQLLRCLTQDHRENQWACALIKQLHRDIDGTWKDTLLTSKCTEKLKHLCERFRDSNAKGRWASCLEGLRKEDQQADNQTNLVLSQKKRKSESMDHYVDIEEDIRESKRVKMDFSPAREEKRLSEEESKIRTSQQNQSPASGTQTSSDLLGSLKILPDHIKAAVPVIKELLDTESGWDENSVSALKVLHECDPDEVEVLCSVLCLSEAPEQSLPQFCSCLLELSPDLSHSTASAVITKLLLGKILSLEEPASRCLVTAVASLCSHYPRPTCQAVIEPVLRKGQTGSAQAELLCRLVEDCLEPHHRLLVFRTILEVSWDEGVLSVIHALLDSKLEMSEEDFSLFTNQLSSQSQYFSKSMTFAKMMLSVLTKYQSHVNAACHHTLSSCLSYHETFLKKSLQAALKRISI